MRSIRNIVLTDIVNGVPKADTMAAVQAAHPQSAAARKFKAHYAWYKGWLKKNPAEAVKFLAPATEQVEEQVSE